MTITRRMIGEGRGCTLSARCLVAATLMTSMALSIRAATAQDTNSAIEQVPAAAGLATNAPEIMAEGEALSIERTNVEGPAAAPQIGVAQDGVGVGAQLTHEERAIRSPTQLDAGGRSAEAPEALSQRSEGRTGAIERVAGSDRCNQPQTDPAIVRACARAIETRAAEFARPDPPPLSPEQRLLVEQRLQEGRSTAKTAVRRLAEEGEANTAEGQAVASVALGNDPRGPAAGRRDEDGSAVSAETKAVIEALVGSLVGNPPPPPMIAL